MSEQRPRLYRLVKDGKVVGYQKFEDSEILHVEVNDDGSYYDNCFGDILETSRGEFWGLDTHDNYIPHDRIDQYTGVDVDGVKVFERDQFETEMFKGTVEFLNGQWFIDWSRGGSHNRKLLYGCRYKKRLTGIEGVN